MYITSNLKITKLKRESTRRSCTFYSYSLNMLKVNFEIDVNIRSEIYREEIQCIRWSWIDF